VSDTAGAPRAPYSLEPTLFPFPALASMAGSAPLGGPREIALACFLVARIAGDAADGTILTEEQRRERAQSARQWLGTASIPVPVKTALVLLAEAAGQSDRNAMKSALDSVMTVTANQLDSGPRLELGRLAQAIAK
jgi:hypothetical protein